MKRFILSLGLVCVSTIAQADVYGLVNGRTADVRSEPQLTGEAGLSLQSDLNTIGAQVNFKVSPDALIYGTIANVDPDAGSSDIAIGGGVVYQFDQNVVAGYDVAFKGSYHQLSFDSVDSDIGLSGVKVSNDLSDLGLDFIVSPAGQSSVLSGGTKVFGLVGLHRISSKASGSDKSGSTDETELSLGFGAIVPAGVGEVYASVEFIDEVFVGLGYRMAFGQK